MDETPTIVGDPEPDADTLLWDETRPMDLPHGAELNGDGSVTLTLIKPLTIALRPVGGGPVQQSQQYATMRFRRLTGAEVQKTLIAKDTIMTAIALSSELGAGRLSVLNSRLDARDAAAMERVVGELLDADVSSDLPAQAEETPDGIVLPLLRGTAEDDEGTSYDSLIFKPLTAAQRRQASAAPDTLSWAVSYATGLTPARAKALLGNMDGADAFAAHRVVLFLCGAGRKTGR